MSDAVAEYIVRARDDASKVLGNISSSVTDLRDVMSTLATSAGPLGIAAVAATGLGAAVAAGAMALADNVEQLDRMSASTGVSVENLQVMRRVVEEGGGNFEGMSSALTKLNLAIENGNPMVKKLGLNTSDTFTAFRQLSDILISTTDAKQRDAIATALMGKTAAELIPDLLNMASSFDATHDSMKRAGALMGGDALKSARELDAQTDKLKASWADFATSIEKRALPVLANLAGALADATRQALGLQKTPQELAADSVSAILRDTEGQAFEQRQKSLLAQRDLQLQKTKYDPTNLVANMIIAGINKAMEDLQKAEVLRKTAGGALNDKPTPTPGKVNAQALAMQQAYANHLADPLPTNSPQAIAAYELGELEKIVDQASSSFGALKNDMEETSTQASVLGQSLGQLKQSVASSISNAIQSVISGAATISQAFSSLMKSILEEIATSLARLGIGLGLQALGIATGQPWLVSVGAGVSGSGVGAGRSTGPAVSNGNTVFNINTLNAKDMVGEIMSPTGSLRGANDYVRAVSRASR